MILTRIRLLAGLFVAVSFLVGLGLASLMLFEHEDWLERSYRNRWAYRDVPSRRGAILDRRDRVIREDRPGVDMELQYWEFRREHPLGAALHGANLLNEARKHDRRYSFDKPEQLSEACASLLSMSCTDLREDPFTAEQARDLQFYAYSLLKSLSGLPASKVSPPLRVAARKGMQITVLEALRESLTQDPAESDADWGKFDAMAVFAERLEQMQALAQRLLAASDSEFELWQFLEQRRELSNAWRRFAELPLLEREALSTPGFASFLAEGDAGQAIAEDWQAWLGLDAELRSRYARAFLEEIAAEEEEEPEAASVEPRIRLPPDEARPIMALRMLPYEQARWFGLLQEWHPGWILRAAVERVPGPGADSASLNILVGRVTQAWVKDGSELLDRRVDSVISKGSADDLSTDLTGIPEVMQASLLTSITSTIRNYYMRESRVGRNGVEKDMDDVLTGRPGLRMVERDRRAREQQMFRSLQVAPGRDVAMSIDLDLQRMLEEVLLSDVAIGSRERAMAIIDAESGEILAIGAVQDNETITDGEQRSWSLGATFPSLTPNVGSVVKPFVLLEHLDAMRHGRQFASHAQFLPCERRYQKEVNRARRPLMCDGVHGADARDPVTALAASCNIFFFQAVEGLTAEGFGEALAQVGWKPASSEGSRIPSTLFQKDIPGIPVNMHADPKLEPAYTVLEMQGIGYGVHVNAMQVARAYAALGTGKLPSLSLIRGQARPAIRLQVAEGDLTIIRNGLRGCVLSGTASRVAGLRIPGLEVHGKTGTAEISKKPESNNAWFAGFIGRGEQTSIAFAAVAYRVTGHGADVGGEMIARFLAKAAANPKTAGYLRR